MSGDHLIDSSAFCVMMMGRTAAGKTTLARQLSEDLGLWYVPEAAIKRALIAEYKTSDSLREDLREVGYAAATAATGEILRLGRSVCIDAAFHRRARRASLIAAIRELARGLVIVYCKCDDLAEVSRRIARRSESVDSFESQANSMDVYRLVDSLFDELLVREIPAALPCQLLHVRTDLQTVMRSEAWCRGHGKDIRDMSDRVHASAESHVRRFSAKMSS